MFVLQRTGSFRQHAWRRPPTTLIAGFLGAGKRSLVKHLLASRAGLRIGLVVNDVAAVNVDGTTLRPLLSNGIEMLELENGCVCCGPDAEKLGPTILELLNKTDRDGVPSLDHVVVEISGVADPSNVQGNLAASGVNVHRTISLVDTNAFPIFFNSTSAMRDHPELVAEVEGILAAGEEVCEVNEQVAGLLLRQVESADVIIANKIDLATAQELATTIAI